MVVTSQQFLLRYPEMKPVPPDLIDLVLAESEQDCPARIWNEKQNRGIMLLTAHVLTLRWFQIGAIASSAASIAEGKGGGNGVSGSGNDDLSLTEYGQQFKRLRSQLSAAGVSIFTF